jgi:hypothetical protein
MLRGDLLVGDEAALGAVLVFGERGDELGLELVGGERRAVLGGDGLDGDGAVRCGRRRERRGGPVVMVAPSVEW